MALSDICGNDKNDNVMSGGRNISHSFEIIEVYNYLVSRTRLVPNVKELFVSCVMAVISLAFVVRNEQIRTHAVLVIDIELEPETEW